MRHALRASLVLCAVLALAAPPGARAGEEAPDEDVVEIVLTESLPLHDFLRAVGMVTGTPYLWNPNDEALQKLELVSPLNLRAKRSEVFSLVRSILASYQLGLVPLGPEGSGVLRVVDLGKVERGEAPGLKPVPVDVSDENAAHLATQDGLFVTTLLPSANLRDLDGARDVLVSLASGLGRVVVSRELQALAVTDFAPNVAEMYRALDEMDRAAALRDAFYEAPGTAFQIVSLAHADARELAKALHAQFVTKTDDLRIQPESRTNALLVGGPSAEVAQVLDTIQRLDVPLATPDVWTHVVRLERQDVDEVASTLKGLLPDPKDPRPSSFGASVRLAVHAETNTLLVTATPKDFEQLKTLIEALDKESE